MVLSNFLVAIQSESRPKACAKLQASLVSRLLNASEDHMAVRKTVAWWLLLLALSPFTAPFSTCDLTMFFVSHQNAGEHIARLSPRAETLVDDALAQLQSPESPAAGRTKFFVPTRVAVLLQALTHLRTVGGRSQMSSPPVGHLNCSTSLRI
jgi:hypothetical protein